MQLQHHKEQQQFQYNKSKQDWKSVFRHVLCVLHHEADEGDFVHFAKVGVPEVFEASFILPWDDYGYVLAYASPKRVCELHKPLYLELWCLHNHGHSIYWQI